MSRRPRISASQQRRQNRAALLQWIALALVAAFALAAAFLLTDGSGGTHVNAPDRAGPIRTV